MFLKKHITQKQLINIYSMLSSGWLGLTRGQTRPIKISKIVVQNSQTPEKMERKYFQSF